MIPKQARGFVWGMQTSLANFLTEQLDKRSEEIGYVVHEAEHGEAALATAIFVDATIGKNQQRIARLDG